MTDRLNKLKSFKTHPWFLKAFKKLTVNEIELMLDFVNKNEMLDKNEFELAINRLFIDKNKSKNWKTICELLSCCNN